MLPRILCENVCSLNPNEERLTFSVIWKIHSNGDILGVWFGRTIINSAAKLTYDMVQSIIENKDFKGFPEIRPQFTIKQIQNDILNLNKIANCLRKKRNGNCKFGSRVELDFEFDPITFMPKSFSIKNDNESNKLVEEFMLLANIHVANRIQNIRWAILRRNDAPNKKRLKKLFEFFTNNGYKIESMQDLWNIIEDCSTEKSKGVSIILKNYFRKLNKKAEYICNRGVDDLSHYDLNVPFYTHFTSPIRRYPDILVHRLLAALQGYEQCILIDYQSVCEHCNEKAEAAKMASLRSEDIYFSMYVNEYGPLYEDAYVCDVKDRSFEVLIERFEFKKRIYCNVSTKY